MVKIIFTDRAIADLQKLPKQDAVRIFDKIETLKLPALQNSNTKSLKGIRGYRMRVASHRIIFEVFDDTIEIQFVKKRSKNTYK